MWYAKPSGAYAISSTEGTSNIIEMRDFLRSFNYTDEAITGVIANSVYEGGLNPWRWENDEYPPSYVGGCGLFGFTPYTRYLETEGAQQMNLSVTDITPNASATVGSQQMRIMADGTWGWVGTCWREYWDKQEYAEQYTLSRNVLDRYGGGSYLTQSLYAEINDISSAVFAFLACFEGPLTPNYTDRLSVANQICEIITGTPPTPPRPSGKKLPVYMMIKRLF